MRSGRKKSDFPSEATPEYAAEAPVVLITQELLWMLSGRCCYQTAASQINASTADGAEISCRRILPEDELLGALYSKTAAFIADERDSLNRSFVHPWWRL